MKKSTSDIYYEVCRLVSQLHSLRTYKSPLHDKYNATEHGKIVLKNFNIMRYSIIIALRC